MTVAARVGSVDSVHGAVRAIVYCGGNPYSVFTDSGEYDVVTSQLYGPIYHQSGCGYPPYVAEFVSPAAAKPSIWIADGVQVTDGKGGVLSFNGRWPDHHALRGVADQGRDVVLQLKTNRVKDVAQGGNPLRNHLYWVAAMFRDAKCHVLLDGSGGRGVAFDPAEMRNDVRTIRKTIGYFIGLGVAGGLCAETVRSVERLKGYDVSIDAEGMLRDGDDGGTMNLDKVAAYLEAAGRVLR